MKKILIMVCIIGMLLISQISYSLTVIYDEEAGMLYLGGNYINNVAYMIDKKLESNLRKVIHVIDLKKSEERVPVSTDDPIRIFEISSKNYIGLTTMKDDLNQSKYRGYLSIYNAEGNKMKVIEDVITMNEKKYFSWSPDGTKITYITGELLTEGKFPFETSGVWIYDIEHDKAIKISKGGASINWSEHDNNIYIGKTFKNDPPVIEIYNTSTGMLEKSDRKGMIFSDDGKYYIGYDQTDGYGYSPMYLGYIFENSTNKKKPLSEDDEFLWRNTLMLHSKFINNTHYLLTWDSKGYRVIDVDEITVIRKVDKKGIIGWNKDMTKVVVYEGGDKIHIDELLTGKRLKSIEIPK